MLGFSRWISCGTACAWGVLLAMACGPKTSDPTIDEGTTSGTPSTSATDAPVDTGTDTHVETGGSFDAECEGVGLLESRLTFEAARDAAMGQYWYTTRRPVYDGFIPACYYTTTIIVDAGVVVERRVAFEMGTADGDPSVCTTEDFVEVGDEVGTAEGPGIAPPALLETLYDGCCDEVIHVAPADEYDVTFEVDEAGMMSACYWVQVGCADGCDGGLMGYGSILLEEVGFGPPPA